MSEKYTIDSVAALLRGDTRLVEESLILDLNGYSMRIRSNHPPLLAQLKRYFSHVPASSRAPDIELVAIEREVIDSGIPFTDWPREPGKSGRKDSYFDLADARVLLKIRTGMLFLQSQSIQIAAGPCLENDNQVINFICSQYMTWLQQNGWLICHASGLEMGGRGVAIAGFSGGGKSTLMLNMLENGQINYLTNDRLFIRSQQSASKQSEVLAQGIPKLPRINPGTIVHNPRLHSLLPPQRRESLLQLPPEALWQLEEKYDVLITSVYGRGRVSTRAPLHAFVILNWDRESDEESRITEIDISQHRELLAAVMKSPGPFYWHGDGHFQQEGRGLIPEAYLDALDGVAIHEVSGKVDFENVQREIAALLRQ